MCDKEKIEKSSSPLLRGSHHFQDYEMLEDSDPEDPYYAVELVDNVDRIIGCVVNGELEELAGLLTTPKRIVDVSGTPLLHIAIYQDSDGPFDYLLELGYDIEETDRDGETPLAVALSGALGMYRDIPLDADYFAVQLLNKGADLNNVHFKHNPSYTPLHFALERNYVETAKILITRKVDLEARNDSEITPIQSCIWSPRMSTGNKLELISMMIFHGAQITSEHVNFSLEKGELEIHELISDYVPASDLTAVTISADALIKAMKKEPKLFRKVCEKIVEIEFSRCYWRDLLKIKADNFSWLMQNFEYETDWILREALYFQLYEIDEDNMEVLDVIFQSQWRFLLLEKFQNRSLLRILNSYNTFTSKLSFEKMRECLIFFLSHGVDLYDEDLQLAFKFYGYTKFFKELLQFDVEQCKNPNPPYRPMDNLQVSCIYEINKELPEIMENFQKFSLESLLDFLGYSARSQLVEHCRRLLNTDENVANSKIATLPNVPKLQEFARDQSRRFLVQTFGLKSTRMFYGTLQRLPIPEIIKKIISFEVQLY